MDECSLGVHEIEFVIDSWEDLSNSGWVRDHTDGSHDFSKISTWNNCRWLIVDTTLEASWAPVNELDGSLGLNSSNGCIDILGDDITSVHEATGHVFTMSGVTLCHHGSGFEGRVSDLSNWELLVISFLSGDDWGVWWQHEMDSRIWHQVGLEFSDINVKSTIESKRCGQRWNDLSDESVQVGIGGSFNIEISSADIIDSFVIEHDCNISMFKEWMGGQDWVVWFNDGGWNLRWWVNGETEFGFLSVIDWESLEEEWPKSWSGTTTNWVEDQESLETSALVSQLSDSVKAEINDFFTNSVMASGEVVSSVFLTGDQLFWVE